MNEANETYRAASAIAAFDAIQVAFAALVKKGILSKAEAEQILMQASRPSRPAAPAIQAAELLAIALEKISKFEPTLRSRRASQPKPINCLPTANGCARSSTMASAHCPLLKKVASLHCSLTMSQGNSRTNGISDRESNSQANCEDHRNFGHTGANPTAPNTRSGGVEDCRRVA
jgi:hypothetical protein